MVETSHDSLLWERDATYSYYKHGPLARTVLGQQQVQGVDYAFTLQGWLKGVNATSVNDGTYDMGGDGKIGGTNSLVARDAYGFSLNYYSTIVNSVTINDYKSINTTVTPFVTGTFNLTNTDAATIAKPLFNGNIASMFVNIPKLGTANLYGYSYDQLNRIISMDAFGGFNNSNNTWTNTTPTASSNYKERITYDANGNIKTYLRNGTTANSNILAMDNLTYGYNITNGKLVNNKLRHVKDAIGDANYTEDIDNQPDDNYDYDAIGNLIRDTKEGITNITWTVYGKISSIAKASGNINYTYDASGNRISKTVNGKTTWYVRDASGNVMAVYEQRSDLNSGHLTQSEVHLYGSSRLCIFNINRDMITPPTGEITIFERGRKFFEGVNHLGNVLVTVSDRKLQVQDPANTTQILYYTADVVTATDYYPFGMMMPGRKFGTAGRYGFNGQERTKELGESFYEAEHWEYDARIGRRWNIDPVEKEFESPYATFSNNPIWFKDTYGADTTSGTINVFVTSTTAKNDKALKYSFAAAKAAEAKSKGNLVVLEVKNLGDLNIQLKKLTKDGAIKINNLIIDSHGDYDKAKFMIGGTKITEGTGEGLRKLGTYMNSDGNVVLLACHAGGNTVNGGEKLLQNLSKTMRANVYGSRSWTGAIGLFAGGVNPSQMSPDRLNDDQSPLAWDFLGQWNVSYNQGINSETLYQGISLSKRGNVSRNNISPMAPVQKGIKKIKKWLDSF